MGRKRNWDKIQKQDPRDTVRYRDVYEDQQLERSKVPEKQSPVSRIVLVSILTVLVMFVTYIVISLFQMVGMMWQSSMGSALGSSSSAVVSETDVGTDDIIDGTSNGENTSSSSSGIASVIQNDENWQAGVESGEYDARLLENPTISWEEYKTEYYTATDEYEYTKQKIGCNIVYVDKATGQVYNASEVDIRYKETLAAMNAISAPKTDDVTETNDAAVNEVSETTAPVTSDGIGWGWLAPTKAKVFITLIVGIGFFGILYQYMMRNLEAQNLMSDTSDINQYSNDQHIALPEEVQRKFDWFPDVGAHCPVMVSSMISHVMLQNKGLNKVQMAKRAEKDILDEDGNIEYFKGEVLEDDDGEPLMMTVPLIDEKFGVALFDASGALNDENVRKTYDATKIPYNPGNKDRNKLKDAESVADMINKYWTFPDYEPQRPAGAYLVDTEPVNTMVLAITRAGKGQTVIEPTIDMWTRESKPNNMVINDPKGELLVKNYVKATVRGFQVVQFNLINAMKTDIYNPLAMAADAARDGDSTKCAMYVENIADVFFPLDGGDDPVWPNAANNAFKRAAYGLIDYYLEEEKELRLYAERVGMDDKVLESKIDQMWGKVTLYNCYQLFTQLTSKKMKNPAVEFSRKAKNGEFDHLSDEEYEAEMTEVELEAKLWEDKPELDLLTLYFNATEALPRNMMRTLVSNANNALKSMAGAEKMMSSVYGIAITAMSFFTDPTISTLTSGTPSQNVDLGSLSFPRRLGVRLNSDFLSRYHLVGMQVKWMSYEDKNFTKAMGKDFYHEDMITREGWAMYYFQGKYPKDIAYIKMEVLNPQTGMLIRTFYFQFQKSYQTSLDGRYYVTDPVLGSKIVKNGILSELKRFTTRDGKIVYKKAKTSFAQIRVKDVNSRGRKEKVQVNAIIRTMVRYSEKAKIVFLVTPPHLMKYAKLILILIKQLVDLNFDKSYMTKSNQKPLYKTRFMLDELGNLQSEGHGISNFQTMLSIGLGQEQQFTLILQTLQQLRDVYGDSVDKIVQGNVSNIVFLKSTDDSMLDTLQKMSGTTHRSYTDSKTITRDTEAVFKNLSANEGKVSYTMTTREEPVIKYNDMAFISERNSIVFRAGDSPIWNRNETILPMSWRLFTNTIIQPGKDYSLQTIPTLSSAIDFDVRKNQPNFYKMLEKRKEQAKFAQQAMDVYKEAYGYTDYQIEQLDPDNYADDVMDVINRYIQDKNAEEEEYEFSMDEDSWADHPEYEDNVEQFAATAAEQAKYEKRTVKRYAGGMLSADDLGHALDTAINKVYTDIRGDMEQDRVHFFAKDGSLYSADGVVCYIRRNDESESLRALNEQAKDAKSGVYSEGDVNPSELHNLGTYEICDEFYKFLKDQTSWQSIANGRFERAMAREMVGE